MPDGDAPPTGAGTDVEVGALADGDAATVAALLDAAERAGGDVPRVDEAERRRLEVLAATGDRADGWFPVVARLDDEPAGYGAIVVTGPQAIGDAGVAHDVRSRSAVLTALLDHLASVAAGAGTRDLEVWVRDVVPADVDAAASAGYRVARRLAILGRDLPTGATPPAPPAGVTIRSYTPDDDVEVVRVLDGAYAGTDDGGWDLDTFRTRTTWDWFRADDLLVADDGDGRLLGLHWLKRRDAATGEVHNLAIHPDAQGRRLGPALLHAGLDHLAATGCDEVLLWVDRANERAVRLYEREGFTTRWDDVAFARDLDDRDRADRTGGGSA